MEKEAGILTREMKIALTFQKQAYAVFFAVMLSLVRGVAYSNEIGIALEAPMAILAFTFCADTYVQEIAGKRSEIWRLCPEKADAFYLQTDGDTGHVLAGCGSRLLWIGFSVPKAKRLWNGTKRFRE